MRITSLLHAFAIISILLLAQGCSSLGSASKTFDLQPGMSQEEVVSLLGRPGSTQHVDGYTVWKYKLHKYFVGWVPTYLAFDDSENGPRLVGWQENMQEYYANQSLWLASLPPPKQQIEVDHKINHTIDHTIRVQ